MRTPITPARRLTLALGLVFILIVAPVVFACTAAQRGAVDKVATVLDDGCPAGMAMFDGGLEGKVCGTLDMVRAAWLAFERIAWPQGAEPPSPGMYRAAWARELVKAGGVRVGGATPQPLPSCSQGPSAGCK